LKAYQKTLTEVFNLNCSDIVLISFSQPSLLVDLHHSKNIITNLASLPDFLKKPMLKGETMRFFSMKDDEKEEIVNNALQVGPTIPFDSFAGLFKIWLDVLSTISEEQREELFTQYIKGVIRSPGKLVSFNMDGIFEVYLALDSKQAEIIAKTLRDVFSTISEAEKNKIFLVIPEQAKIKIGL